MKTIIPFLCASLVLSFTSDAFAATSGDVTDLKVIDVLDDSGPYNKIWEPYIAKWTESHYVTAYGLQLRGKGDMGDIVCSISLDRGKTWSPRKMIFNHQQRNGSIQFAYNNSVLFRPPGQDVIWLFAMRAPLHYRDSENADLCAAYTADGGYSWHPVELAMDFQSSLIIVAGIETVERNGFAHYLLPAHRNSKRHDVHGDRRQFVLESKSLLRWKLADYVPMPSDKEVFLHEGAISVGDRPDELKMVMRTADMESERPLVPPLAYSSISRDGGITWAPATPEPELPNYRAKSFFGKDTLGSHIYVYNDMEARRGLWYRLRPIRGKWSQARLFYFEDNRNSYPTLIEDQPANWLAVWDSSDSPGRRRTAIRFGRLKTEP